MKVLEWIPVATQTRDVSFPLYVTRPSAGFPVPGDDTFDEALNVHDLLVEHPQATFFVRVAGDSMEGVGIFSGDILVVDRSIRPRHGSIVVAAVYGEMVVKQVQLQADRLALTSAKEGYDPIVIVNGEDCVVWGVVVGSVRRFT